MPGGVQLGPPSVTLVRCDPSGRSLSMRTLKQPPVTWATTIMIQSSLDHAMSPNVTSSGGPEGSTTRRRSLPSARITHRPMPDAAGDRNATCDPSGDHTPWLSWPVRVRFVSGPVAKSYANTSAWVCGCPYEPVRYTV